MRLKYQVVKELCQLMTNARIKIIDTKNILENLKQLKWTSNTYHLTLVDYQYHFTDFYNEMVETLAQSGAELSKNYFDCVLLIVQVIITIVMS